MAKKSEIKFDQALDRLEEITCLLEEGGLGLEEATDLFNEGCSLVKLCSNKLKTAQQIITEFKGEDE